jgi:ribonuclease E
VLDADTSNTDEATTQNDSGSTPDATPAERPVKKAPAKKAPAKKAAKKAPAKKAAAKKAAKKAPARASAGETPDAASDEGPKAPAAPMVLFKAPEKTVAPARRRTAKATAASEPEAAEAAEPAEPDTAAAPAKKTAKKAAKKTAAKAAAADTIEPGDADAAQADDEDIESGEGGPRRRRRRGGRRRRKGAGEDGAEGTDESDQPAGDDDEDTEGDEAGSRRRRTRVRKPRNIEDEITSIGGSTRLAAKKQRRQEGREAGRRRAPIVSEAEFLARREAVERVMVIRQRDDLTQIGVIEDKVLVEHYVARESQTSLIGNIYLGRVQNVLPSMEAAFIDVGKGRNAVLYAGEVNWSALGHKDGQPRKIESVLKSGQTILVQVTKDPVGHKGARLTGQISLPGRFLVYVPDGNTSGISRKLPDTERNRLKNLLKEIVPDTAGVIVRTAAEGASEDELTNDVERLTARWAEIEKRVEAGKSPDLLYGEPDLTLKVVRDLFTEDFTKLVVEGDDAWDLVDGYVSHVAPDLQDRLERYDGNDGRDIFASYRVDEQIAKGLDRKVWLPSGGSLVIDRTEAMTVVDVNTGKFTGSGGNLEETVTKNNLEAAEEIVRQLRLRDIGGIIVVDFIDMVLESNRDLVLRRLVECLGRDRTRHQVAEVTSLGLVQMTRKRIGTGLLEAFSEECEHCKGRGVIVHDHPVEPNHRATASGGDEPRGGRRARSGRSRGRGDSAPVETTKPSPMALAGTKPHPDPSDDESPIENSPFEDIQIEDTPVEDTPVEDTPVAEATAMDTPVEEAPVEEAAAEEPPAPAPLVVTSTRRRRAGRPAGPPVAPSEAEALGSQVDGSTPASGDDDLDSASVDEAGGPSVLHVPVKKKGSRKR